MIVHQEPIPPIWHPIDRFFAWRKRRAIAKRPVGEFKSFQMPIIKQRYSPSPFEEIVTAQMMSASFEKAKASDRVLDWKVTYERTRWYARLWRWAKGDPGGGCCR